MSTSPENITQLLRASATGNRQDLDALMAAVYEDMRRLAASHLRGERGNHTLQPTALVHEAYVKLIEQHSRGWKDRLHFFSVASRIIRRILVDHARSKACLKRGGGETRLSLHDQDPAVQERDIDLVALDEALQELAVIDERQARIIELRYFGGCSVEEVSELLGIGARTVDREWRAARAWLMVRLEVDESEDRDRGPGHGRSTGEGEQT